MKLEPQRAKAMGAKSSRKGVPNKATQDIRQRFKDIVENNISKFQDDLNQLEPKERLRFLLELSKFILPTLKAVDMQTNADDNNNFKPVIIQFTDAANTD